MWVQSHVSSNLREFQHSVDKRLEIGVVNNSLKIALEMDHVNEVKPDQRGEQTHVSFGECALPAPTNQVRPSKWFSSSSNRLNKAETAVSYAAWDAQIRICRRRC